MPIVSIEHTNQMHTNGTYSWPAKHRGESSDYEVILSFDPNLENFTTTFLPDTSIIGESDFAIHTIGESGFEVHRTYLALNEHAAMINAIEHEGGAKNSIDIWVLFHHLGLNCSAQHQLYI